MTRNFALAIIILGGFWPAFYVLQNEYGKTDQIFEAIRILAAAGGASILCAYCGTAVSFVRKRVADSVEHLGAGISLGGASLAGTCMWFLFWRVSGRPDWMLDSPWLAWFVWCGFWASVLHMTGPRALAGQPNLPRILLAGWLGIAVAGILIVTAWAPPRGALW